MFVFIFSKPFASTQLRVEGAGFHHATKYSRRLLPRNFNFQAALFDFPNDNRNCETCQRNLLADTQRANLTRLCFEFTAQRSQPRAKMFAFTAQLTQTRASKTPISEANLDQHETCSSAVEFHAHFVFNEQQKSVKNLNSDFAPPATTKNITVELTRGKTAFGQLRVHKTR